MEIFLLDECGMVYVGACEVKAGDILVGKITLSKGESSIIKPEEKLLRAILLW